MAIIGIPLEAVESFVVGVLRENEEALRKAEAKRNEGLKQALAWMDANDVQRLEAELADGVRVFKVDTGSQYHVEDPATAFAELFFYSQAKALVEVVGDDPEHMQKVADLAGEAFARFASGRALKPGAAGKCLDEETFSTLFSPRPKKRQLSVRKKS